VAGNVVFNAMAGYALTRRFPGRRAVLALFLSCMLIPFQATIIPAYLVTGKMGLTNTYLGLAFPLLSTIVCIFLFKAAFEAVPRSLIDAARIDGLSEWRIILRVLMPLSKPAIATNVILSFIWSWNNFLWPLIITRDPLMQTLPLGLARFLSYVEDTTGALTPSRDGARPQHPGVPDGPEGIHPRPHGGGDQGMSLLPGSPRAGSSCPGRCAGSPSPGSSTSRRTTRARRGGAWSDAAGGRWPAPRW